MTLPINVTLPLDHDLIKSQNPQQLFEYMRKLVYVLTVHIQQANQSANGNISQITDTNTPGYEFVQGSTAAGNGTYSNCIIWTRRSNLLTTSWFDITWSATTGTGNVLVQLPYFSQPSTQLPFIGVIESDSMTFTAGYTYLTGNLTPGTNLLGINQNGSGQPVLALPISGTGHLRGFISYVGQQFS